jgi:hypothetical protein
MTIDLPCPFKYTNDKQEIPLCHRPKCHCEGASFATEAIPIVSFSSPKFLNLGEAGGGVLMTVVSNKSIPNMAFNKKQKVILEAPRNIVED